MSRLFDSSGVGDTPKLQVVDERATSRSIYHGISRYSTPIKDFKDSIFQTLSKMFDIPRLAPTLLDRTGIEPKLLFRSEITYALKDDKEATNVARAHRFTKDIFLSVGVHEEMRMDVKPGQCKPYGAPGISMENFKLEGGFRDSAAAVRFYNRVAGGNCAYGTAAAFQMARYYYEGIIVPTLYGREPSIILPEIEADDDMMQFDSNITCFMPSELLMHDSAEALALVYHALEAKDVMAGAGYDDAVKRVWNGAGDLPEVAVDEEVFWHAFDIIKQTLSGDQTDPHFDMDFIYALIKSMPLHGRTTEGGVWRQIFNSMPIRENMVVVVSSNRTHTTGFARINPRMVIGSVITMQTLVGRVLYESDAEASFYALGPMPPDYAIADLFNSITSEVTACMASVSGLSIDYWNAIIGLDGSSNISTDRHISGTEYNWLGDFGPILPSYSQNVVGEYLGKYVYTNGDIAPLVFSGTYGTKKVSIENGSLLYSVDLASKRKFSDGWMYADARINPDNGLSYTEYVAEYNPNTDGFVYETQLVDGSQLNPGDRISDSMWGDNGDFLPSNGELRSTRKNEVLITATSMPWWVDHGAYNVVVGTYCATSRIKGERKDAKFTRRTLIGEQRRRAEIDINKRPPSQLSMRQYMLSVKRMTPRKFDAYKRSVDKSNAKAKDAAAVLTGKPTTGQSTEDILKSVFEETVKTVSRFGGFSANCIIAINDVEQFGGKVTDLDRATYVQKAIDQADTSFTVAYARDIQASKKKSKKGEAKLKWGLDGESRVFDLGTYVQELLVVERRERAEYLDTVKSATTLVTRLGGQTAGAKVTELVSEQIDKAFTRAGLDVAEFVKHARVGSAPITGNPFAIPVPEVPGIEEADDEGSDEEPEVKEYPKVDFSKPFIYRKSVEEGDVAKPSGVEETKDAASDPEDDNDPLDAGDES